MPTPRPPQHLHLAAWALAAAALVTAPAVAAAGALDVHTLRVAPRGRFAASGDLTNGESHCPCAAASTTRRHRARRHVPADPPHLAR